jgi:hypothetical protein
MSIGPDITEPATPTPPPGAPADGAAARRERQLDILSDLAEAGREIAMALKGRIVDTAAADPDPASAVEYADLARAFDRVSRATRMAIALSRRLEQDEPLGGLSARTQAREARDQQAGRVLRIVRRVAQARGHHSLVREAMERQARERLFDPDITGELLGRPIGALVAQICADLGLPVPWLALAEEAWAQAEITERPPGSPYAAWPDLPPDPPVLEGLEDPEDLDGDREGEGDWDDPGGSDP